ncbi:hypothetical protein [Mesorhizobium sp.]|uniref:hypothetical protein n=1 Tax=Mesorhizobium sp. TaxID=1871066 RepID=UPI0025BCBF2A|nr:hypothetical protein [Mesorhizobium sp.]
MTLLVNNEDDFLSQQNVVTRLIAPKFEKVRRAEMVVGSGRDAIRSAAAARRGLLIATASLPAVLGCGHAAVSRDRD